MTLARLDHCRMGAQVAGQDTTMEGRRILAKAANSGIYCVDCWGHCCGNFLYIVQGVSTLPLLPLHRPIEGIERFSVIAAHALQHVDD